MTTNEGTRTRANGEMKTNKDTEENMRRAEQKSRREHCCTITGSSTEDTEEQLVDRERWVYIQYLKWMSPAVRAYLKQPWQPRHHSWSRRIPKIGWWLGLKACRSAEWSSQCFSWAWSSGRGEDMNLDENNPAKRSQSIRYIYKTLFVQFNGSVYFVIGSDQVPLKTPLVILIKYHIVY